MGRERLGELLLRVGVLSPAQLDLALQEQARTGVRLGQILVDHALIEEVTLFDALAQLTSQDRFDLRTVILDRAAMNLVTAAYAEEKGLIPFRIEAQNKAVHVATSDPTNYQLVDELSFKLGFRVKIHVASETEVLRIVRHHFYGEALDRDARNVNRPSGKRPTGDIDPSSIVMDEPRPTRASTPAADPEMAAFAELKPIFEAQDDSARALRALFELCVSRGIITREEYLDRLRRS